MNEYHKIDYIIFDQDNILLKIDDIEYRLKLMDLSPKLALAAKEVRLKYKISPSGYGIHWPLIDEDLSIDGIISQSQKDSIKPNVLLV